MQAKGWGCHSSETARDKVFWLHPVVNADRRYKLIRKINLNSEQVYDDWDFEFRT